MPLVSTRSVGLAAVILLAGGSRALTRQGHRFGPAAAIFLETHAKSAQFTRQ